MTTLALLACPAVGLAAFTGQFQITVIDRQTGKPIPCRVHLKNAAGKTRKIEKTPFWDDHFALPGTIQLKLPLGNYTFEMERGLEYTTRAGHFEIKQFADDATQIDLNRFVDMSAKGWWSGDLDIRRPVKDIELLMGADDLHVAQVVTWQNAQSDWAGKPPAHPLVTFDTNRCYQLMAGRIVRPGVDLLLLNLAAPLKQVGEPAKEFPPLAPRLFAARKEGDLWIDVARAAVWDLPMLVAHGQVDSIQLANGQACRQAMIVKDPPGKPRDRRDFPDPFGPTQWSQQIYFQLLECGLRIPPSAGSSSGAAPNPVGYNRMYVHVDGPLSYEKWLQGFRAGQVFLTNGPLMQPTVEGELPGHVFHADQGETLEFELGLTFSTRDPISYLDLIKNGKIEEQVRFEDYAASGKLPKLKFDRSGWFAIRAVSDLSNTYRFALTAPYYVEIGYQRRISRRAVKFFLDWVYERGRQIKLSDPEQQQAVLEYHKKARDFWQDMLSRANAE